MKHVKNFRLFESEKIDFFKKVKELDAHWTEIGGTTDSDDIIEELVEKYGEEYREDIEGAVSDFYDTDRYWDEDDEDDEDQQSYI